MNERDLPVERRVNRCQTRAARGTHGKCLPALLSACGAPLWMPSRGRGHHSGLAAIFVVVMVEGEWFVRKGAEGGLTEVSGWYKGEARPDTRTQCLPDCRVVAFCIRKNKPCIYCMTAENSQGSGICCSRGGGRCLGSRQDKWRQWIPGWLFKSSQCAHPCTGPFVYTGEAARLLYPGLG